MLKRIYIVIGWIFSIPPVEKRPKLNGFVKYFIYMDYHRELDDTYIYYKTFLVNLALNILFLSLYFISFGFGRDIDLGIFEVVYRRETPVDELIYGYPIKVFPILLTVTVLHSLLMFIFKTDYFSADRIRTESEPFRSKNTNLYDVKSYRWVLMLLFVLYGGLSLSEWRYFLDHFLFYVHDFSAQSNFNFCFFSITYFFFYQVFFGQALIIGVSNLVRRILKVYFY
jgi:hypothetical protein